MKWIELYFQQRLLWCTVRGLV